MEFKKIVDHSEIIRSLERGKELWGNVTIPLSYALQGDAWGVYIDGKLVGGFLIITRGNFRTLDLIPDHIKKTKLVSSLDEFDIVEPTAVWLEPKYQKKFVSIKVWTKLISETINTKKKTVLFAYNYNNRGLVTLYKKIASKHLFIADRDGGAGINSHANVCVAYTTTQNLKVRLTLTIMARYWRYLKKNLIHTKLYSGTINRPQSLSTTSGESTEKFLGKS